MARLSTQKRGETYRVPKVKGIVLFDHLIDFIGWLGDRLGFQIEAEGLERLDGTAKGIRLKVRPSSGTVDSTSPLQVSATGVVTPGTVGGVMPTIGGTALDAGTPPTLTIPSSGTRYITLNITGTFGSSTLGGNTFIAATMSSIAVTITVDTTEPVAADLQSTSGSFKVKLATFVDGVKTLQNGYGPLALVVQDSLDGSGTGLLVVNYPG